MPASSLPKTSSCKSCAHRTLLRAVLAPAPAALRHRRELLDPSAAVVWRLICKGVRDPGERFEFSRSQSEPLLAGRQTPVMDGWNTLCDRDWWSPGTPGCVKKH